MSLLAHLPDGWVTRRVPLDAGAIPAEAVAKARRKIEELEGWY